MQVGRFHIEQLSEGLFEFFDDGGFQKITMEEVEERTQANRLVQSNSVIIGIDPILVHDTAEDLYLLLDAGLGLGLDSRSRYRDSSNVSTNLSIFDLATDQIDYVLLTHLHYDHAAGISFTNDESRIQRTFPNATILVQQQEWDFALAHAQMEQPSMMYEPGYQLDDLYRLYVDQNFHFISDEQFEVLPGLTLVKTGGHTPGHQVVKIKDGGEICYYLGDLVPNVAHLNSYAMKKSDDNTLQAKEMKHRILREAYEEDAYLLFYHSRHVKFGRLAVDEERNYILAKE